MVAKEKWDALQERLKKLQIKEEELIEKFVLGSGKGGQKINKTSSCVYLKHIPTGIQIKCQRERSREMNRFYARRELCDRIEQKILGVLSSQEQEKEKIRRQKKRRSRKSKQKMLEAKKKRGEVKAMRAPIF